MNVTIVTVTYNSSAVIGAMLNSVPVGVPVIVVDNGSSDDTVTLASAHPEVRIIKSSNIGFGRGSNLGLREVTTDYALVLNPDAVLTPDVHLKLTSCAEKHKEIGILGAQVFHYEKGQKHYARRYDFDAEGLVTVDWIVGACMFIRMEALRKVGMFDENIFLFYEETDLCQRFMKAGYKLAVLKEAEVEHNAGNSSPASIRVLKIKAWHAAWSKAYYYRKNFSTPIFVRKTATKLIYAICRMIRGMYSFDRREIIKNYYEFLGLMAYIAGMKSFQDGVGRLT